MEDYLLRIVLINFNENLTLLNRLCEGINSANSIELGTSFGSFTSFGQENGTFPDKFFFLDLNEELEHFKIDVRFVGLAKLCNVFVKNSEFTFMLNEDVESAFNVENIKFA